MSSDPTHADTRRECPPLIELAGDARECGRQYARLVVDRYPGYWQYLDFAFEWTRLPPATRRLVEARAPYLLDLYEGLVGTAGCLAFARGRGKPCSPPTCPSARTRNGMAPGGCTSFGVAGGLTASRLPMAGQNKDTVVESLSLYIVLKLRMTGGPTILVLAYPGEVLGYGLWSTGMSLFRNALYSREEAAGGLSFIQWGLLALAGGSVPEAAELAERHGIAGSGNCLITDAARRSASVEFNAGGVSILPARDGIAVHANHPEGEKTAPLELFPSPAAAEHSRYRAARLRELLELHRGRLAPESALAALADHSLDKQSGRTMGLCRHAEDDPEGYATTAAIIAEPAAGVLHVVRGQPCQGKPVAHRLG